MKTEVTWPRQPFLGLALAAIVGILVADYGASATTGAAVMMVLGAIALLRRSSLATYAFVASCFFCIHSLRIVDSPGIVLARELGNQPRAVTVHGFVVSEPKTSARGTQSFLLQLASIERDRVEQPCHATVTARWAGEVRYGDELRLFGVAAPTEGPRNPGEFDMRSYLARREVLTSFISRYRENGRVLARGGGNRILAAAQASRKALDAALARGLEDSPDQHALISGIILGLRDQTPDEIEEQFQQTGTIHLFAVAGLHVGMVAYLLWIIATAIRLPRKAAIYLIIPGLFFYAAITGLNTASLRAATMAAIMLGGTLFDRKVLAANSLAAAAFILLCCNTQQLFSMGFQLSFAVVGSIILFADRIFAFLLRWFKPDPFLPPSLFGPALRFGQASWHTIARGASISLAAWIGSLPLILPYFYLVTPVSLFANLTVVPLAFLVLAIGLMALLATPLTTAVAVIFNNANWSIATLILAAVGLFARAPAGHFYLGRPHWPDGAVAEITALDLAAGAAIHLHTRRKDWLIDCGAERDFKRVVRGYLRSRGINRLDGLVLTHGDAAHIGAATAVMRTLRPADVVDTGVEDRSSAHKQLLSFISEHQIAASFPAAPQTIHISPAVDAHILFPPPGFRGAIADDQAFVLQLVIANRWRVLLMSDSGEPTENALLNSGADLRSDVVIKGQHHSGISGTPEFLDRVQPQLIVASSTDFSENERLKDDWAATLASRGIKLLRQDQTGAVTLRFFRDRWQAKPFIQSEVPR